MRVFMYSEARKRLADVLDYAVTEKVIIKRQNGDSFAISSITTGGSPFDIKGIQSNITSDEIVAAVRNSREFRD